MSDSRANIRQLLPITGMSSVYTLPSLD